MPHRIRNWMTSTLRPSPQPAPANQPMRHPSRVCANCRRLRQGLPPQLSLIFLCQQFRSVKIDPDSTQSTYDEYVSSHRYSAISSAMLATADWLSCSPETRVPMCL